VFQFHVKCRVVNVGLCHHGMAHTRIAGGGGLQVRRLAVVSLNKQWRTATRGGLPAWGLGGELMSPYRKNPAC
jgi:hypothetical protein